MATRDENLKRINAELENLSDEELEKIAGGIYVASHEPQGGKRLTRDDLKELEKIEGGGRKRENPFETENPFEFRRDKLMEQDSIAIHGGTPIHRDPLSD